MLDVNFSLEFFKFLSSVEGNECTNHCVFTKLLVMSCIYNYRTFLTEITEGNTLEDENDMTPVSYALPVRLRSCEISELNQVLEARNATWFPGPLSSVFGLEEKRSWDNTIQIYQHSSKGLFSITLITLK